MAINLSANSASDLMESSSPGRTSHDVVDLANGKAYRHLQCSDSVVLGDVVSISGKVKPGNGISGISLGTVSASQWRFVQSFGKATAKVATSTPANAFLTPDEATPGVLRAMVSTNPERVYDMIKILDERDRYDTDWGAGTDGRVPAYFRIVISLTAESGGLADVFIC